MKKILITTALLTGVMSFAGGFRVSLQGVKQLAMAHTSAHAEDASVIFFNPAGMAFIPQKLSIAVGGFGAKSEITYQDRATRQSYTTNNPLSPPGYAGIAYKVTNDFSVGFSFASPFGSHLVWGDQWTGREVVEELKLQAFYFQPAISYKFNDWMSIGASYIYTQGTLDWDRTATSLSGSINLRDHKAEGNGFGFGFYFRPNDKLDVSVAYRSPIDITAKRGVATFNVKPSLYSVLGLNSNGQDGFKASLPLVEEYTIGLTYKVTPKWSVSGDFNYSGWERYSQLVLDFSNAKLGSGVDPTVVSVPKNFKNTKTFRIGTQYWLTDKFAARLGYYFDESPYTDDNFSPETPSFDNNAVTAGFGVKLSKQFGVDVAGSYNFYKSRNAINKLSGIDGQLKGNSYTFGLGLTYNPF